jgi:hypothetical protein
LGEKILAKAKEAKGLPCELRHISAAMKIWLTVEQITGLAETAKVLLAVASIVLASFPGPSARSLDGIYSPKA